MADIDKSLPNQRPEDELLQEQIEEVDVADQLGKGPDSQGLIKDKKQDKPIQEKKYGRYR